MVNNTRSLLELLKETTESVSGEILSRRLGISRVGVWKQIKNLINSGYRVSVDKKGYRLISEDGLLPQEFPDFEDSVSYTPHISSTMKLARDAALQNGRHGDIFLAGAQTQGQGLGDEPWESPLGGLYLTLLTKPTIALAQFPAVVLHLGTTLASMITEKARKPVFWLWPSGWYLGSEKLGGILPEIQGSPEKIAYLNLGVGFCLPTPGLEDQFPSKRDLVKWIRQIMIEWCESPVFEPQHWLRGSPRPLSRIELQGRNHEKFEGSFSGYTQEGHLVITTTEGIKTMLYGQYQTKIIGETYEQELD